MNPILEEFRSDLSRVKKLINLLELIRVFRGMSPATSLTEDPFFEHVKKLQDSSNDCHADLVVLSGTLILYIAGRFEFFVRTLFEELCDKVASKSGSYDKLPRVMRSNLILYTAEVMKDHRKYGHGEKGVESFIKNLAANLSDRTKIETINSSCLSITYENMWPDTLKELFERIGAKDIWDKIGQQAIVQTHFETGEPAGAKSKAITMLNTFMELRNRIAHPSRNITWPDTQKVTDYVVFLDLLAEAIAQVIGVYEVTL